MLPAALRRSRRRVLHRVAGSASHILLASAPNLCASHQQCTPIGVHVFRPGVSLVRDAVQLWVAADANRCVPVLQVAYHGVAVRAAEPVAVGRLTHDIERGSASREPPTKGTHRRHSISATSIGTAIVSLRRARARQLSSGSSLVRDCRGPTRFRSGRSASRMGCSVDRRPTLAWAEAAWDRPRLCGIFRSSIRRAAGRALDSPN